MEGLTCWAAAPEVRADSPSCRGDAQGSARNSMAPSNWNPFCKERPVERWAVAQPCVGRFNGLQTQGEGGVVRELRQMIKQCLDLQHPGRIRD